MGESIAPKPALKAEIQLAVDAAYAVTVTDVGENMLEHARIQYLEPVLAQEETKRLQCRLQEETKRMEETTKRLGSLQAGLLRAGGIAIEYWMFHSTALTPASAAVFALAVAATAGGAVEEVAKLLKAAVASLKSKP